MRIHIIPIVCTCIHVLEGTNSYNIYDITIMEMCINYSFIVMLVDDVAILILFTREVTSCGTSIESSL